jgi:hypothetical protein
MQVRLTLQPGQRGTKRFSQLYGEQLVCVRYRYDAARQKRFTTVELIVGEQSWQPSTPEPVSSHVCLLIARNERELQRKVKMAGGQWNPKSQLWEIARDQAFALDLANRIQDVEASICRDAQASANR